MGEEDLTMQGKWVILMISLLLIPKFAFASETSVLLLSPSQITAQTGSLFDVRVFGNTAIATVDTVRSILTFDPMFIRAQTVSLLGEFDRSAPGNYLDNKNGVVSWGAFTLDRPVQGAFDFATVTFQVIKEGETSIAISSESRMIQDGIETLDDSSLKPIQLHLQAKTEISEDIPILAVSSSSHSVQTQWYQKSDVTINWLVLPKEAEIKQFFVAFDDSSVTNPSESVSSAEFSKTYKAVKDGIHYFHVKGELANGEMTPTVHTRINIDTSKPNDFVITPTDTQLIEGETLGLIFATTDEPSGVAQYQLAINDGAFEAKELPLEVKDLKAGTYFLRIAALDRAGNVKYSSTSVRVYPQGTDLQRPIGYNEFKETSQGGLQRKQAPNLFVWISLLIGSGMIGFVVWKKYRHP